MAIELYWDNEDETVMHCIFSKGWTWDEMFQTLDKIKKVTSNRTDEVGAIIDVTGGVSVPGGSIFNADTRNKAMKMLKMSEDGKGPMVILGANGFIKTIYNAFSTLDKRAQSDVYFAETLDEARDLLADRLAEPRKVASA